MALLDSEIARMKVELGYPLLSNAVEPWIGITMLFDQLVEPYMTAGAATTSSTAVTAATTPTPVAITLASATGFAANDRVVVDVDTRQETATVQSLSGAVITLQLSLTHSGTYPVTVEGGESIIREILRRIYATKVEMSSTFGEGALKKVDVVEFYQSAGGDTLFGVLGKQLAFWRAELASAIGIGNVWSRRSGGAQRCAVY